MPAIVAKREKRRLTVVRTMTTTTQVVKELKVDVGESAKVEAGDSSAAASMQGMGVTTLDALASFLTHSESISTLVVSTCDLTAAR